MKPDDVTFGALEAAGLGQEHTKLTVAERKRMMQATGRDPLARSGASRTIGRWEPKRKDGKPKRNVWKQDGANRCYVEHASAEPATPLLDRLQGGSGPARTIPVSEWQERQPVQPGADTRHLAEVWK